MVVFAGVTGAVPVVHGGAPHTVPTPWSITTMFASFAVQVSVAVPPDETVSGVAFRVTVTGETDTVAMPVAVPPGPVAVAVKVVVCVMLETCVLPDAGATEPTPWSIVSDVAFAVDHVSVDVPPEATAVGEAEKVIVGGI